MKKIALLALSFALVSNIALAGDVKCNFKKYKEQSAAYINKGDFRGHIELTNACIVLYPELENLYNNRANSYKRIGDYKNALADYNKAIELNQNYNTPYIGRANLYVVTGDYKNALADFNKAIEIDSNFPAAYINRGNVRLMTKDFDGALADFKAAQKLGADQGEINYRLQLVNHLKKHPGDLKRVIPQTASNLREVDTTYKKYTKEEVKTVENAMFLYGFVSSSATSLENFCKTAGYVPNKYLNLFNQTFKKTIDNMNLLFAKINPEVKKELDNVQQEGLMEFENTHLKNYEGIKKDNSKFTKQQYCKAFDDNANQLVETKVKMFKKEEPSLFLD